MLGEVRCVKDDVIGVVFDGVFEGEVKVVCCKGKVKLNEGMSCTGDYEMPEGAFDFRMLG